MSSIVDALVNLWRLLRNICVRLLGRPPEYVWIEAGGSLPEFETPVGFLRRSLSPGPGPTPPQGLRARPPECGWIEAGGSLPEFETPVGFLRRSLSPGPGPITLEGLRARLDRISADGRTRAILLRVRDLDAGWAALEELR